MVLKHFLGFGSWSLLLFCNQFAFGDDVEAVSLVSLLDDVASSCVFFLLEGVTELLLLIGINFSENFNFGEDVGEVFSLFGGCLLHNVVKGGPIQSEKFALCFRLDRGSSWSVVHQCQFSEELSSMICLEVGLLPSNHFEAVVVSLVDDVEGVSDLSLNNDFLAGLGGDFFHGVDDNVEIIFIEVAEEDAFLNQRFDLLFGLGVFGDDLCLEITLLVELSEHLGADSLATVLLFQLLFLLFLNLPQKGSLRLLAFFFGVGMQLALWSIVWINRKLLISLKEYSLMKEAMFEGRFRTIS